MQSILVILALLFFYGYPNKYKEDKILSEKW